MEKLATRNYMQKRIIYLLFNEKWYNKIKLFKIILLYKFGKRYEMSSLLDYIITKDSTILDIGANMGQYACRLNKIVSRGTGHVYSFEPVTDNFDSLRYMKNILKMQSVTLNKMGVSNVEEEAIINIPLFENGLIVGTRATLLKIDEIRHRSETIKVTTIDNFVDRNRIKMIDFIKCDTEGNESNVLEGGKLTITKHLPILSFEMSHKDAGLNWLIDLGYELFYHDLRIDKLRKIDGYQSGNLILLNKKHQEHLTKIIEMF